ncbi:MAG: hypothetical protein Q8Q06_03535 [bacterium]|nr:hypothetical protein [bacterium]
MKKHRDFGFYFWVHLAFILLFWLAPFLVSWRGIVAGMILYAFQIKFLGGCILTHLEFKGREPPPASFYHYYLTKAGLKLNPKKVSWVVDYGITSLIIIMTLIWQFLLGKEVLIK